MMPEPDYIYKCPNCNNLLKNKGLFSGNTFGSILYSDGKSISPMLPEFPELTKCKRCNTIFWLSKLVEIEICDWGYKKNSNWTKAEYVDFLDIEDYFRALNEGLAETLEEELFIRTRIWWAYNDRIRGGKKNFLEVNEEALWRENCKKLLILFDQSFLDQKIMIAELKRNLGDFKGCIYTIKTINNPDLNWLKEKFIYECEQKNKWVIQLEN